MMENEKGHITHKSLNLDSFKVSLILQEILQGSMHLRPTNLIDSLSLALLPSST